MSINECLETGPNLLPHLFDVVIKFRGYPIAMVADVEKAFHQVIIAPEDRRMIRFLWFDDVDKDNPEIVTYQFCHLPFGLTSSPTILSSVLQHHFSKHQDRLPDLVSLLKDSFYLDDLATGASNDEEANRIYEQSSDLMSQGGFRLRKWHTNSEALRERIMTKEDPTITRNEVSETVPDSPDNLVDHATSGSKQESQENSESSPHSVKVLGVGWNYKTDTLHQEHSDLVEYAKSLPATKRSVLKLSAKIFDPIGLITPLTIHMKVLFQMLCSSDYDWDDELTPDWLTWRSRLIADMSALRSIQVPRCYFSWKGAAPIGHQLHGFSDASCKAYVAVVYLRTEHANGDIEVNLVASKARVAPIKRQSIPRLELLGATILARLMRTIENSLVSLKVPPEVFYWTDSLTTLCWIRNNKVWKPYVQHRVEEIRQHSDSTHWRFVQGVLNPADLPSRGCTGDELSKYQTWWNGPQFLKHSEENWPEQPHSSGIDNEEVALSEMRKTQPAVIRSLVNVSQRDEPFERINEIIDCTRYSMKLRLLRVTATVRRCARIWRQPKHAERNLELTAEDLKQAERMWIKAVQQETFPEELQCLKGSNKTPKQIVSAAYNYMHIYSSVTNRLVIIKGRY